MLSSIQRPMVENNHVDTFSVFEDMVDCAFMVTFKPYFRQTDNAIDFVNNFDKRLRKLLLSKEWDNKREQEKVILIKALIVKYMRNL